MVAQTRIVVIDVEKQMYQGYILEVELMEFATKWHVKEEGLERRDIKNKDLDFWTKQLDKWQVTEMRGGKTTGKRAGL